MRRQSGVSAKTLLSVTRQAWSATATPMSNLLLDYLIKRLTWAFASRRDVLLVSSEAGPV